MQSFRNHLVRRFIPFLAASLTVMLAIPAFAQGTGTISITLSPGSPRAAAIPTDFLGISLEMSAIMAANNPGGNSWLNGTVGPYSTMLKKIGVGSVRIGGNSSERQPYAATADGNNVNAFAQLIGANLLWTVPAKTFYNPTAAVTYVQGLYSNYTSNGYTFSSTIEIGNEPDNSENLPGSAITYSTWQSEYDTLNKDFRDDVSGSILSSGPAAADGDTWPNDFSNDAKYSGTLKPTVGFVTEHNYPEGSSTQYASVTAADAAMLSITNDTTTYPNLYNGFGPTAIGKGFKPRLEETNSMYGGGSPGASNSYAAALWAEDYFCYMAYNTGLAGMNLHTGPIGSDTGSYNPISPVGYATAYNLEGPGYGMWAFHYGSQGQPVPTAMTNSSNVDVTAYGLLESNGGETVHVINKTFDGGTNGSEINASTDLTVHVTPGGSYTTGQVIYLQQASNDVTATTGITFGGQPMNTDGTWTGGYGTASTFSGTFTFTLSHSQAAIVHFY